MAALILIIGLVGPAMAGNPSLGMPIPLKIEMPRLTACPNDCENGRV